MQLIDCFTCTDISDTVIMDYDSSTVVEAMQSSFSMPPLATSVEPDYGSSHVYSSSTVESPSSTVVTGTSNDSVTAAVGIAAVLLVGSFLMLMLIIMLATYFGILCGK